MWERPPVTGAASIVSEAFSGLRGRDPQKGLQKPKTLERLGLSDMIPKLKATGLAA